MSKETSVELNRTDIASESRSSLPADLTSERAENALELLSWLGSFWTAVYKDPDFIEYMQDARALRIAQLYLDLLENLKLEDRENIPVFHRERWHPIVLRKSQAGTGSKDMLKLVDKEKDRSGIRLGDDQKDEVYPNPTMFTLGGEKIDLNDMVVYPLSGDSGVLKTVLTCICNNIAKASVVLGKGSDFTILPGAIAISKKCDPFIGETADEFPKFEILEDDPEDNDEEVVLWACDTMFDKDFVYKSIGYAMAYPRRETTGVPAPDLFAIGKLTFEPPDEEKFPSLRMAREALAAGGAACAVLNGANEAANAAFLRGEISFGEIYARVARALDRLSGLPGNTMEDIREADRLARLISDGKD